jgi:hypothetical protein
MKRVFGFLTAFLPLFAFSQHDHHVDDASATNHSHLAHMQPAGRKIFTYTTYRLLH